MFTHVMVGTNDVEKARKFYDAVFRALGLPGMHAPNGASWYGDPEAKEAMFAVVTPRDGNPACFAASSVDARRISGTRALRTCKWQSAGLGCIRTSGSWS